MANKAKTTDAKAGGPNLLVAVVLAMAIALVVIFGAAANDSRVKTISTLNDRLLETIKQRDEAVGELVTLRVKSEKLETRLEELGEDYIETQEELTTVREALKETRKPGIAKLALAGVVGLVIGIAGTTVFPAVARRRSTKKRRNSRRR